MASTPTCNCIENKEQLDNQIITLCHLQPSTASTRCPWKNTPGWINKPQSLYKLSGRLINGFYARDSVIAFEIAPPSRGSVSYNFKHSKFANFQLGYAL